MTRVPVLSLFAGLVVFAVGSGAHAQIQATPVGEPSGTSDANREANAKEDLFAYADLLYTNEQWKLAGQQYRLFLEQSAKSPNAEAAWFRLGECYLKTEQQAEALQTFGYLVKTYKEGAFVGSSAYRLATFAFNEEDFPTAITYFNTAASNIQSQKLALQAKFYAARSQQLVGEVEKAIAGYEDVHETPGIGDEPNPFKDRALLEIARLRFDGGDEKAAFENFETLAKTATNADYRAEALARAGLLAAELGKVEASNDYLDQALKAKEETPWKVLAQVGLIFNYFAKEDYPKVIDTYISGQFDISDDMRPKVMLVVGHSYRLTDKLDAAIEMYSQVEEGYRETPSGAEAGYRRLQSFLQQGDGGLPVYIERYVNQQREIDPKVEYIDLALLMKAEHHFANAEVAVQKGNEAISKEEFDLAAQAYEQVRTDSVPDRYHAARLYKLGWARIESGDPTGGIESLTDYVAEFPEESLVASAMAKRGMTYQSVSDFVSAVADYEDLVKRFPKVPEAEFALQQVALIHGQQREPDKMIAAYQRLLEQFPETSIKAEANYRIGIGHFDQKQYAEAVAPLETARKIDAPALGEKASLRLILAHYFLEDLDQLTAEVDSYLKTGLESGNEATRRPIPPAVLSYLGQKWYQKNDFTSAEKFLSRAATPEAPEATPTEIWEYLGQSRLKLKDFSGAIDPLKHYLAATQRPSLRADALVDLGRAQLCADQFVEARESVRESLKTQKEGRTNARARLMLGDVAAAEGDFATAAQEYFVVAQVFVDPEITPYALEKAANAYRQTGDESRAVEIEATLKADFPNFKPGQDGLDSGC